MLSVCSGRGLWPDPPSPMGVNLLSPVIAKVIDLVLRGWAEGKCSQDLKVFYLRKDELSVLDDRLLWGSRIVIPAEDRNRVLEHLHECHAGISRMKSLACSYVWWPGMDSDIEQLINTCDLCQHHQKSPDKAPIHPWEWPTKLWLRLHIDYAGPFHNKMFLILIVAHLKWLELFPYQDQQVKLL